MSQAGGTVRTWLPAISGMVCLGLGAGLIGIYGFFVEDLSREFAVGAATINIGPIALLLVPGIVAPFVGKLIDRVSPRRIMLTGSGSGDGVIAGSKSGTLATDSGAGIFDVLTGPGTVWPRGC